MVNNILKFFYLKNMKIFNCPNEAEIEFQRSSNSDFIIEIIYDEFNQYQGGQLLLTRA
jgi:hypothetical protein